MKMRSVMNHNFSMVPSADIPRSSFDRSHGYKTTFNSGELIPFFVDEALPGDTFNLRVNGFARMATPIFPVMDNMFMETFFFAVPMRLVWDNWQRFCGERSPDPDSSVDFVIPELTIEAGGIDTGSLGDYFGLPIGAVLGDVSALPIRAYYLIWNEWFRDQNLQDSVVISTGNGPDALAGSQSCLRRGKRHDYFTSALPWPQKGDAVEIPIGGSAPVVQSIAGAAPTFNVDGHTPVTGGLVIGAADTDVQWDGNTTAPAGILRWNSPNLIADLSLATAQTINQLRQAFQVQRLLERDARGGTRYTEIVRAHFGVVSPDARLQRPEYLGGGSSRINVVAVPQTSETVGDGSPQGNLAAYGTGVIGGHGFVKSFTEHCIIIGMVNVRADITYQQGLNRMWSRRTRFDFYWPALSHIGEQAVLSKEIFADGTAGDEDVFGYQERYAEYRYKPSVVTGEFRSAAPAPLDAWHLALDFADRPTLSAEFIEDNPPIARVIAISGSPEFLLDTFFQLRCARPMPMYGVPGMIDHF